MLELQVALMDVVPSAVAALNLHRGNIKIASTGLGFLQNLAMGRENKVAPRCDAVLRLGSGIRGLGMLVSVRL
jgi:hypothetical protein